MALSVDTTPDSRSMIISSTDPISIRGVGRSVKRISLDFPVFFLELEIRKSIDRISNEQIN